MQREKYAYVQCEKCIPSNVLSKCSRLAFQFTYYAKQGGYLVILAIEFKHANDYISGINVFRNVLCQRD